MEKIILTMIFCTGLTYPSVFAADDSSDAHIANTLSVLFKMIDEKAIHANDYAQTTFVYNGMPVTAFKSNTSSWVGFFKKLSADGLPVNALTAIQSQYKNYNVENVTMYFNNAGDVNYFAEITLNKNCIILKLDASGSIKVFNCTPRK